MAETYRWEGDNVREVDAEHDLWCVVMRRPYLVATEGGMGSQLCIQQMTIYSSLYT